MSSSLNANCTFNLASPWIQFLVITCKPYSFLATWFIAAFIQDSFSISQSSLQLLKTHVGFLSKSNQIQSWLILEISCEVLLSAVDNYPLPSTNILSLQYLSRLIAKCRFYSWNIDTYLSYFYPSLTFCCILLVARILHNSFEPFWFKASYRLGLPCCFCSIF